MKSLMLKQLVFVAGLIFLASILSDQILGIPVTLTHYGWRALSHGLIAIPLIIIIQRTWLQKYKLAALLWAVLFVIGTFNILIEAYIFNVTSRAETLHQIYHGLLTSLLAMTTVPFIPALKSAGTQLTMGSRSLFGWIWRVLVGNVLYFIFYGAAGFTLQAIYPALLTFYEDKMPPLELVVQTNLFFRGFIFTGIGLLIMLTTRQSKFKTGLLIGLTFSILGALAPLISPNEFMPQNIRLAHGFEVGISNFLFGLVLGYLLTPRITHTSKT